MREECRQKTGGRTGKRTSEGEIKIGNEREPEIRASEEGM